MLEKIKLGSLIKVHSGESIEVSSLLKYGDYPVYGGNGINGYCKNYNIPKDTMIIGRVGEKCGNVNITFKRSWISDNALIVVPLKKHNIKYLEYLLKHINLNNYANKNAQPVISGKIINDIDIEYNSNLKEQKSIADTLTNIDNLIDSLQKIIEKKEKIFKAATQELLNGKNRVYEWKKVRIGDIGKFTGNGVDKKIRKDEQKIRILNYMDIMHYNFIYSNISNYFATASNEKINKCSVKKGDIFLTPSSETRLDIGVSSVAMEDIDDLVYSYHIVRFRPIIEMDLLFRAYIFKNQKFLNQASTMCEGSGKRYVCSNKKFASFELEIPIDIREQKDIANKLYAMEKEVNMLKNKLLKYKQIKEGMMEDLLTGKVRLDYE